MALLTPHGALGYLHGEAIELDRKLREGDGLMWQGDPALSLNVGVMTAKRSGYDENVKRRVTRGEAVARRYEVWRHTEDGEDVIIGSWRIEEFDKILFDLVQMDPRSRGHEDLADRLDKADEEKAKADSEKFRDTVGPMIEHQMKLAHDIFNPRNEFFGVNGLRDQKEATDGDAV